MQCVNGFSIENTGQTLNTDIKYKKEATVLTRSIVVTTPAA
jgi:hypothetical protein